MFVDWNVKSGNNKRILLKGIRSSIRQDWNTENL